MNAAARLVIGRNKYEHIIQVLRDVIHWLPVTQRIFIIRRQGVRTYVRSSVMLGVASSVANAVQLEMLANAQRDMAALPNVGGALCSTPQFG